MMGEIFVDIGVSKPRIAMLEQAAKYPENLFVLFGPDAVDRSIFPPNLLMRANSIRIDGESPILEDKEVSVFYLDMLYDQLMEDDGNAFEDQQAAYVNLLVQCFTNLKEGGRIDILDSKVHADEIIAGLDRVGFSEIFVEWEVSSDRISDFARSVNAISNIPDYGEYAVINIQAERPAEVSE